MALNASFLQAICTHESTTAVKTFLALWKVLQSQNHHTHQLYALYYNRLPLTPAELWRIEAKNIFTPKRILKLMLYVCVPGCI